MTIENQKYQQALENLNEVKITKLCVNCEKFGGGCGFLSSLLATSNLKQTGSSNFAYLINLKNKLKFHEVCPNVNKILAATQIAVEVEEIKN